MSSKQRDQLDAFTSKMVKEIPQETPSINFSKNVMDAIYALETKKELIKSPPLISKKVWVIFIGVLVAATFYLVKNTESTGNGILSKINFSSYTNAIFIDMHFGFKVSDITIYGFIFFAIMVSIQIGYIKNYYNSRYQ